MQFIHSNKKYIERSMYPINPYMNAPEVPLTMEAFIAPVNFDPDAQELNIVKAFAAYANANKKYIFSVGTSTSTVLPAATGRSYAYSENGGAYTTIASGTVTWTVGSTKRNVVVVDSASSVIANIANGGVWCYCSEKVYSVYSANNIFLKYIHCQKVIAITTIVSNAFYGCTGLTNINIPNTVTSIGNNAFSLCSNLIFNSDDLKLSNLSQFGGGVFVACSKLKNVDFSGSTFTNLAISGSPDWGCFVSCNSLSTIILHETLTNIGDHSFRDCPNLTSINIPNSVTSIGIKAFYGCTGLANINIPNTVTSIGNNAFSLCSNLVFNSNDLKLSNLSQFGGGVFVACSKLKNVDFSGSTFTNLAISGSSDWGCFVSCNSLSTIILHETLTNIGDHSFRDCPNLTSINIPNTVASIGVKAFYGCTGLTNITNRRSIPQIDVTDNTFYAVNKSIPLHVPIGSLAAYQAAPYWNEFTNIIADL